MKLVNAWIGHDGKPVASSKGKRYQVRWRLDPGSGRMLRDRKRSDFRTKGECEAFIERLRQAEYEVKGWTFDRDGSPVQGITQSATVLTEVAAYVTSRWTTVWQPAQRTKVRGRFLELIAVTLTRPVDREALLVALDQQRLDHGDPPAPTTTIGWAARYLRVHAFYPGAGGPVDERVDAGRRWLEAASLPVSALDDKLVTQIRLHYCQDRTYSTARTYWGGTIVPFFNWLEATGKVTGKLLGGQPRLRRDSQGERPDRRRIPDPGDLARIAAEIGAQHGQAWELWALVAGFCALRLGESLAIQLNAFFQGGDERWWLDGGAQERRVVAANSDDGKTTKLRSRTKSTRGRTPPPRPIPVPVHIARRLEIFYGDRFGASTDHAFVGPRGATANDATVRVWWNQAVAAVFGDHPTLAGITPHAMRHAGMTYWFAAGRDEKLIQQWGGWQSLKEMLDTYRGVINSLATQELEGLDAFYKKWDSSSATSASESVSGPTGIDGLDADVIYISTRRAATI